MEAVGNLAAAEHALRRLSALIEASGDTGFPTLFGMGERYGEIWRLHLMLQATFRYVKYLQWGDRWNMGEAQRLWLDAARAERPDPGRGQVGGQVSREHPLLGSPSDQGLVGGGVLWGDVIPADDDGGDEDLAVVG